MFVVKLVLVFYCTHVCTVNLVLTLYTVLLSYNMINIEISL